MVSALRAVPNQTRMKPAARVVMAAISGLLVLVRPHRASLANLVHMPLTVAGYACVSVGVFTASTVAGFIVTGLSLMVLELQIADDE